MDDAYPIAALVAAAAHGDHDAWTSLVSRYTPLVASVIRGYRLAAYDAEDVGQTVWLRLVEHLGELREPRALPMWIVTTTRNECLRVLRTGRRTYPIDFTEERGVLEELNGVAPDDRLLQAERQQMLLAAFAALPEQQRQLMLLLITDPPTSYAEISRRLDIAVGSIGPTRARALQRLREYPSIAEWRYSEPTSDGKGGGRHGVASLER